MVSTALSLCYWITDGENFACKPMSQIAAVIHVACNIVFELILLLWQKNMKGQIDVWFLVFAVDVKHFVVKLVDELHVLHALPQAGSPCRAAQAQGQGENECKAIQFGNSHALHFKIPTDEGQDVLWLKYALFAPWQPKNAALISILLPINTRPKLLFLPNFILLSLLVNLWPVSFLGLGKECKVVLDLLWSIVGS